MANVQAIHLYLSFDCPQHIFRGIHFTLATLVPFGWMKSYKISYMWLPYKKILLHWQTKHIYTDQKNKKLYLSTLRASGGGSIPRLSIPWCQSYPEASGGVWSPKQKKYTTDEFHCAMIWNEFKNNKGKLAKMRRKKKLCLLKKSASLLNVNTSMSRKLSSKPDTTATAVTAYKH